MYKFALLPMITQRIALQCYELAICQVSLHISSDEVGSTSSDHGL